MRARVSVLRDAQARVHSTGDRIIYYSPRERMRDGEPVQAFTAIGEIAEGEPEPFGMGGGFVPFRRAVRFYTSFDAPH
jgi:hypothetical protein